LKCKEGKERHILTPDGNYIKTACLLDFGKRYSETFDYCDKAGMRLFVIDSADTQKSLLTILTAKYPWTWDFWLDGGWSEDDSKWYSFSNGGPKPTFSDFAWLEDFERIPPEKYLLALNFGGKQGFKIASSANVGARNFICEFVKGSKLYSSSNLNRK
jgi:hypothetical protein